MAERPRSGRVARFGVFEVDLYARELRKSGVRIKLQQQPFQILVCLLERPGSIVTREELIEQLWPDGTVIEYEHSLATSVNKIRQALGDTASSPRFVETVPRRDTGSCHRWRALFRLTQSSRSPKQAERSSG